MTTRITSKSLSGRKFPETLYSILGVPPGIKNTDLRDHWLDLAKKHHPDKGGDPETFKMLKVAYDVLKNDVRRSKYDAKLKMLGNLCSKCGGKGFTRETVGFTRMIIVDCTDCDQTGQREIQ